MKIEVLFSLSGRGFLEDSSYLTDYCEGLVVVKQTLRDGASV